MAPIESATSIETNLMSNRKVIELLLQLKSARAHGKNYIKVKPHLVRHLLRNHLFNRVSSCCLRSHFVISLLYEADGSPGLEVKLCNLTGLSAHFALGSNEAQSALFERIANLK